MALLFDIELDDKAIKKGVAMMPGIILAIIVLAYTGYVVYKKIKDLKARNSCCGGCSSCKSRGKCDTKD